MKKKSLTTNDLLELICDIAYEQANREVSGINWFREFIEKIDKKQGVTLRRYNQ